MPGIRELERDLGTRYYRIYQVLGELVIRFPGRRGWSETEYPAIREQVRARLQERVVTRLAGVPAVPAAPAERCTITVGADPEFEIYDQNSQFIPANRIFSGLQTQVGTDGVSHTGELRPNPGTPEQVMNNLKELLEEVVARLPYGWSIGAGAGRQVSLGGHIHIGGTGHEPSLVLLQALDRFIGLPLNRKSNSRIRRTYARPSNWRGQPHGYEYRTPCSWIAHPDLARGALTIAHFLAAQSEETLGTLTGRGILYRVMGPLAQVARQFYQGLTSIARIESIQVFRAWGIEREERVVPEERRFPVRVSDDENLDQVRSWGLSSRIPGLTICGAREERSPWQAMVFIPRELPGLQTPIPVQVWERNLIGLSPVARRSSEQDLRATLEAILEVL